MVLGSEQVTYKKVKYVFIEMITKDEKNDVVFGLFKGIIEKGDDIFIILHGKENCINALNLKAYDFMTIEVLEEDYKKMMHLTYLIEEQKDALKAVREVHDRLVKAGFACEDDSIIDVDKYENVPTEYLKGETFDESKKSDSNAQSSASSPVYTYTTCNNTYKPTPIKDPEPSLFSRSKNSKKPLKAMLDLMEQKLNQILEGNYQPEIPETAAGDPSDQSDDTDDDNSFRMYGYC